MHLPPLQILEYYRTVALMSSCRQLQTVLHLLPFTKLTRNVWRLIAHAKRKRDENELPGK